MTQSSLPLAVARWATERTSEGPYQATVLWTAGCSLHCAGCMNRDLWNREASTQYKVDRTLLLAMVALGRSLGDRALVFVGGEPMEQAKALAALLPWVRKAYPDITITVYSGYTYEALTKRPAARKALASVDFLVDGPFVLSLADDNLGYRGSRNQRVIDLNATHKAGQVVLADWDGMLVFRGSTVSGPPALANRLPSAKTRAAVCGA